MFAVADISLSCVLCVCFPWCLGGCHGDQVILFTMHPLQSNTLGIVSLGLNVPIIKFVILSSREEISLAIRLPLHRAVNFRWQSFPNTKASRITRINLASVISPVFVPFEEVGFFVPSPNKGSIHVVQIIWQPVCFEITTALDVIFLVVAPVMILPIPLEKTKMAKLGPLW